MNTSEISKLFKQNNLKVHSYRKDKDKYIIEANTEKYIVKKNSNKKHIFDYLNSRSFNYYPKILIDDKYQVSEYVSDLEIPKEQKINDLVDLMAILHNKTTYNKKTNNDEYENIYEDLVNNYNYLFEYYTDVIDKIDNTIFLSPSQYLIARNISLIFESIDAGFNFLQDFKEKIEDIDGLRVCVIHNDLSLNNYKRNNKQYLLNWDKSKIDIPVFDLYKLYNNESELDLSNIVDRYEKKYPLKDIEKNLLIILLLMPDKITFTDNELKNCIQIRKSLNKLSKVQKTIFKRKS